MRHRRAITATPRRLAAAATVVGLLIAGCSSSDDAGSDSDTSGSSTPSAASDPAAPSAPVPTPTTQEEKDEIEATVEPAPSTAAPEATEEVETTKDVITGYVPVDSSEQIDVTIQPGSTSTLIVTPDSGFDVVIAVTGPGQDGSDIDDGLSGDPETVTLAEGEYIVVVSGWLGAEGGYTGELS